MPFLSHPISNHDICVRCSVSSWRAFAKPQYIKPYTAHYTSRRIFPPCLLPDASCRNGSFLYTQFASLLSRIPWNVGCILASADFFEPFPNIAPLLPSPPNLAVATQGPSNYTFFPGISLLPPFLIISSYPPSCPTLFSLLLYPTSCVPSNTLHVASLVNSPRTTFPPLILFLVNIYCLLIIRRTASPKFSTWFIYLLIYLLLIWALTLFCTVHVEQIQIPKTLIDIPKLENDLSIALQNLWQTNSTYTQKEIQRSLSFILLDRSQATLTDI